VVTGAAASSQPRVQTVAASGRTRALIMMKSSNVEWFWAASEHPSPNTYAYFRKHIHLHPDTHRTLLRVTADSFYTLFVNGCFISHGPPRSDPRYLYYDEIDLSDQLHPGENLLALLVHYLGVPTGSHIPGPGGLLCELEVTDRSGTCLELTGSSDGWSARLAEAYDRRSPRLNRHLGFAEHYDFTRQESDWHRPDGDESAFCPVQSLGRHPRKPYGRLVRRDIPLFAECAVLPLQTKRTPHGWLLDFGNMVSGRISLTLTARTSREITIKYREKPANGHADRRDLPYMYADRLVLAPGANAWNSFDKRAFRCLEIDGCDEKPVSASVRTWRFPTSREAEFSCSDKRLTDIFNVAKRTLRLCLDDIYNDCPHRERAQWMDAYACYESALYGFGVLSLTRKFLRQLAQSQKPDGAISASYPGRFHVIVDYMLVYVLFVSEFTALLDDGELRTELFPVCQRILGWFTKYRGQDGLLSEPKEFVYLDNTFDLIKKGKSAPLNALYHAALRALSSMADRMGQRTDRNAYENQASVTKSSFQRAFGHPQLDPCFVDSTRVWAFRDKSYLNINFFCEFNHAAHGGARAVSYVFVEKACSLDIEVGVFASARFFCNGRACGAIERRPAWSFQPQFELDAVVLECRAGWNEFVVETEASELNWDLYLVLPDNRCLVSAVRSGKSSNTFRISRIAWPSGETLGDEKVVPARPYRPFAVSQLTAGWTALADLGTSGSSVQAMLARCMQAPFYRNYRKVRTPFFCTETRDPGRLAASTLPANTAWSLYPFIKALSSYGMVQEAAALIRQIWGGMLARGATTFWEEWTDRASLCHAWSSYPVHFILSRILGVKIESLRNRTIRLQPNLLDLDWAEGTVCLDEAGGLQVHVRVERTAGAPMIHMRVPAGWKVVPGSGASQRFRLHVESPGPASRAGGRTTRA